MKLSILTMLGNEKDTPDDRQDAWQEALFCYSELADEVIVVNGNPNWHIPKMDKAKEYFLFWPYDWSWQELPSHLNYGLKQCTGDWVLKCDIDFFFHETDFNEIRRQLENASKFPTASLMKNSFILWNKAYCKGGYPMALNMKEYGNLLAFGIATNQQTDLCYPIIKSGIDNKTGLPYGRYPIYQMYNTGVPFYNYDYTFKTKEKTKEEFWRFAQAYQRFFGSYKWGDNPDTAFGIFIQMMRGRLEDAPYDFSNLEKHSKHIRNRIASIGPEQFGFNMWGMNKGEQLNLR